MPVKVVKIGGVYPADPPDPPVRKGLKGWIRRQKWLPGWAKRILSGAADRHVNFDRGPR